MPIRQRFIFLTTVLVPLGVATKLYPGPGAAWVGGNLGGAIYVMFWSFLVLALRPSLSVWRVAGAVLFCTAFLEVLQLWHPPLLEAARSTLPGQAILGSHFSWTDFPYYVGGAGGAVLLGRSSQR